MKLLAIFIACILVASVSAGFLTRPSESSSDYVSIKKPIRDFLESKSLKNTIESDIEKLTAQAGSGKEINERPIIGILTQPYDSKNYNTYIMAAYVKFIEQAGARVSPIRTTEMSDDEIRDMLSHLNGVLYPGGSTVLNYENGTLSEYSRKGKVILDTVKEYNDNGIYYPVWAVCMGFQELAVIEAPYSDTLTKNYFDSDNVANNVTFVSDPTKSLMYKHIPQHLLTAIQKEDITFNSHHDGVLPEVFDKYPGLQDYTVLAHSYDNKGVEYVASYEHKKYPIFANQFHPEKNAFIWKSDLLVPHTLNAIELEQYFANFFVNEAKRNFNKFDDAVLERNSLIENYDMINTSDAVQDIYVFKEKA